MAGAGAKKFPAFSKLSSDDVNNYLADQVIMRFATTTARDAAFGGVGEPTLAEGMTAYIDADNSIYTYDGSNWVKMVSASTPPALELIRKETAIYGTTTQLNISNIFTSQFSNYKVIINNIRYSNTNSTLSLQLLKAGVPAATTSYDFAFRGYGADGTVRDTNNFSQTSLSDLGCFNTTANDYRAQVSFEVINPAVSTTPTIFLNIAASGFAAYFFTRQGAAQHFVNDSYDGMRLFPSAGGNFEAQVAVYGYR